MPEKTPFFIVTLIVTLVVSGFSPGIHRNNSNIVLEAVRVPHRESMIDSIYMTLRSEGGSLPGKEVFSSALRGYLSLQDREEISSRIISIIDFTLPSTDKRMWVIDLSKREILHHTLVAHGKNSGELYATRFSNKYNSNQSSLGFFRTGNIYTGKHGISLKLHGMESGINDQAEARAIVIHSADYVDEQYARKIGRLGRSWGCPAIPVENHEKIIKLLAGGTCLFIYYPDEDYRSSSRLAGI